MFSRYTAIKSDKWRGVELTASGVIGRVPRARAHSEDNDFAVCLTATHNKVGRSRAAIRVGVGGAHAPSLLCAKISHTAKKRL